MSKDSEDSSYWLLLWIVVFSTCSACDKSDKAEHKARDVENRMYVLEKKMDTLIKYQKLTTEK